MNKSDLINILFDWVEKDKKTDIDIGHFIDIKDITSVCGGGWIPLKGFDGWVRGDKYIKIKENIIKNGWDERDPCRLKFHKPSTKIGAKDHKGSIIVSDGNHRIAMLNKYNVKVKVYTKFKYVSRPLTIKEKSFSIEI